MVVKKIIKRIPFLKPLFDKRRLMGSYGLIFVNFIFQRIFRINSKCEYTVHYTSHIGFPANIKLHGDGPKRSLAISPGCYFQAKNGIEIGEGTIWGPGVKVISANHRGKDFAQLEEGKPIKIGKNCWLASNVVILPEVQLGDNTIVGANAVVTKPYPEGNVTLVGVPARPLDCN